MIFMSIFNFLEPGITIIAQAIPMFRMLVVNVKKGSMSGSNAVRISSATAGNKSHVQSQQLRTWNRKVMGDNDEELLHVRVDRTVQVSSTMVSAGSVASDSGDDKLYDGTTKH
jgi:hypothetical protein